MRDRLRCEDDARLYTATLVEAKPLAPNQRRGHVSWLDRLKHLFGR